MDNGLAQTLMLTFKEGVESHQTLWVHGPAWLHLQDSTWAVEVKQYLQCLTETLLTKNPPLSYADKDHAPFAKLSSPGKRWT